MRFHATTLLAVTLLTLAGDVGASDARPTGWTTPMAPGRTAVDAARRIFPGATIDAHGRLALADDTRLRMPATTKERASLPAGTLLSAPRSQAVRSEGKRYVLLLWGGVRPEANDEGGFGEEIAVLAVFPEGSIEPIDVAEVKADRETSIGDVFALGDDQGVTVLNAHHNSSQGYLITDVFHLRGGRLRKVASVFTLSSNAGCTGSFEERLTIRTARDGANPPRVVLNVELVHSPAGLTEACAPQPKARTETFEDRYRWDPARDRYVFERGTIAALDAFNDKSV